MLFIILLTQVYKQLNLIAMKQIYIFLFLLSFTFSFGQVTIFSENMGTATGTLTIGLNTFQNGSLTFTGNADTRTSNASLGYTGFSGGRNVFFAWGSTNTVERDFAIESINASAFNNLTLQFGYRKEQAGFLPQLTVDYWDGTAYVNVPFTFNEAANAAIGWYLSPVINLPAAAQINGLKLRWVRAGGGDATNNGTTRIDDVVLSGTTTLPVLTVNPEALTNFKYVFGNGPSTAQSFSVSGVNLNGGNVTVSVPGASNYEISETENGTYGTSITLTSYNGTATDIFVRLKAGLTINTYTDDITISGGGADPKTVALSGLVKEVIFLIYEFEGSVTAPTQFPSNAVASAFQLSTGILDVLTVLANWNIATVNGSGLPLASSNTWDATDKAVAKNFFLTLNADSGYKIDLTNISFEYRSTGNGPSAITVEINGVEIATVDTAADTNTIFTFPLTIANQSSIEVRIKGWLNGSRTTSGAGNFRIDDVRLDGSVGVLLSTSDFSSSQVTLYPNPVNNGILNIVSPTNEIKEISVFDVSGRMVFKTKTDKNNIDVSQLKAGLYLFNININGSNKTSKIIIN